MVGATSMQDWHNLKLIFFMRPSKTRIAIMKKLSESLQQGARPNLWQLSTATEMIMALQLLRYSIRNEKPFSLLYFFFPFPIVKLLKILVSLIVASLNL